MDDCIKRLLNEDWDSLNNMEPKTVLSLFQLKANARGWSAQSISRFRSTFCKVLMWLDENDYPVKPDELSNQFVLFRMECQVPRTSGAEQIGKSQT
jgi:hypothetical protein